MKRKFIVLILCIYIPWQTALGVIYQWKDENGQINYGEAPPPETNAKKITPYTTPSSSAGQEKAYVEKLQKAQQDAAQKAQIAQEKIKSQEKEAKLRSINCERAKAHLAEVESRVRIRMQDAAGTVTQLTPEQREEDINRTKAAIQEYCSPAKANQ